MRTRDPLRRLAFSLNPFFARLAAERPEKLKELRAKYDEMMKTAVPSGAPPGQGGKKKMKRK